jgi:hypothetical protein
MQTEEAKRPMTRRTLAIKKQIEAEIEERTGSIILFCVYLVF